MAISSLSSFRVAPDRRGVVTAAFDVPGRSYNVFTEAVRAELHSLLDDWEHDPSVRLVLFQSDRLAGGDLREVSAIRSREAADRFIVEGQRLFDRLERLPVPTAAVIQGPCLGAGLEFALACRYRLTRDDRHTQLGLPEVGLGLLPCWGGTQRLPELVGLASAIRIILDGRRLSAREAAAIGLVDAAWSEDEFPRGLERFVADRLDARPFPPREPGLLRRLRDQTRFGQRLALLSARRRVAAKNQDCQAAVAALEAIEQGIRHGREAGLLRERDRFAELVFTPQCRRRLDQFFHRKQSDSRGTPIPNDAHPGATS